MNIRKIKFGALVAPTRSVDLPLLRAQGLYRFVADVMDWMAEHSELQAVSLDAFVSLGLETSPDAETVLIQHVVKVSADGAQLFEDDEAHAEYVRDAIPFEVLGQGSWTLERDDPLVQEYLRLGDQLDDERYEEVVHTLANRMNFAMSHLYITHTN